MNKGMFQRLLPHIIAIVIFLVVAVFFCSPVLQGKVISQSDIIHWKGMAQQSFEYKEKWGHFPLWTNSMFGGMPAYQIAMEGNNKITPGLFHFLFMLFLPKPIGFFFLICIGFYFLCQVYRINPWISILASLAYGYATFSPVLVVTGHDTEFLAMAYVPALLGSLVLLYEKKYWLGGALTALFSFLLIIMNHLQITYYFLIIAGIMTVGYIYKWIKEKEYRHLTIALSIAIVTGMLGVLGNATNIFVTYDYSKATLRNGSLALDTAQNGQVKKAGLPIDYAFNWSYGKAETFTLLVPDVYGGGSGQKISGSRLEKYLSEKGAPEGAGDQLLSGSSYWGAQPFTVGPVYLGAIICFLFIFGLVYLKTWQRWWLLAASILGILMAWGKNFEGFNTFLFNYLPMYNKFRAPTMSLVILQLCFPLVAAMALQRLFFKEDTKEEKWNAFKLSVIITGAILAVTLLMYISFNYKAATDANVQQYFQQLTQNQPNVATELYNTLKSDRQSLFGGDLLRTIILIALAAGIIFLYIRNKIKFTPAISGLLLLNLFDLIGVGKRYLNSDSFVDPDQYEATFAPTKVDLEISKDTGYYRVLNLATGDPFSDAITSYHHNSIGGYHPAKLSIYEDLLNFQLRKQPMNINVLNMLNTKYVITPNQQSQQPVVQQNPQALGNVWFVKNVQFQNGPLAVMKALDHLNPKDTAVVDVADRAKVSIPAQQQNDGTIQLMNNTNDQAIYKSSSNSAQYAVFSEIFYDRGWRAYIDGKEVPIIRTDYVLRGLSIPAGPHEIKFVFHPDAYYTGETVSLIASIIIFLIMAIAAYQIYRESKATAAHHG